MAVSGSDGADRVRSEKRSPQSARECRITMQKEDYRIEDYHYDLPAELIAQKPSAKRESSRLLVLHRTRGELEHRRFDEISEYFNPGDVLVLNDTRVVPARLLGTKESGGRVELLVLDPYKDPGLGIEEGYECLIKAAKKTRPESLIILESGVHARVLTSAGGGKVYIRFQCREPLLQLLERVGHVPLPPYIHRGGDLHDVDDAVAYQTVYARQPGAVAAPTAGLHFSESLLKMIESRGVDLVTVTLHVGYGTFVPIRASDIREHRMHAEYAEISSQSAERIKHARSGGRRVIAVGTTTVRILEWAACLFGEVSSFSGLCNHYIYPGYRFRTVDAMITNFHLPRSTLLLLASAFAGRESILEAYREAIEKRYRFFSYGDAMFIV